MTLDEETILKLAHQNEKEMTLKISEQDLKDSLFEICDRTHASCDDGCPVYRLNGSEIPREGKKNYGCKCFKNGSEMLKFIRKHK